MTVVLEHRDGKTEIVSFIYDEFPPPRVRVRRVAGVDRHSEAIYEERLFHRDRWLRTNTPVYVEQET
jgi:hypothetical protein